MRFLFDFFVDFFIILWRRIRFVFKKKSSIDDYLVVNRDTTFSNSLIEVEFYFEQLIYVYFPQIGRKMYNGKISLITERMVFPYEIEVATASGKARYVIPNEETLWRFSNKAFEINKFQSFSLQTSQINKFKMLELALNQPNELVLDFFESKVEIGAVKLKDNNKIKVIKHKKFNKQNYL